MIHKSFGVKYFMKDCSRSKLGSRVTEAEETIDSLNAKISATEKTKHRIDRELEDLQMEYERTHAAAIITEKRGHNFDKVLGEWKAKVISRLPIIMIFNSS